MYYSFSSWKARRISSIALTALFAVPVFGQTFPDTVVVLATPTDVVACGSMDVRWTITVPGNVNAVAITNVTVWVTNLDVDQTPESGTQVSGTASMIGPFATPVPSPSVVGAAQFGGGDSLPTSYVPPVLSTILTPGDFYGKTIKRRHHPFTADNATSITISPSWAVTASSDLIWSPVTLPPNNYYEIHLSSIDTAASIISARSARFLVSAGSAMECLDTGSGVSTTGPAAIGGTEGSGNAATGKKSNGGLIAGIVAGCLAGLAILAIVIVVMRRRERPTHQARRGESFLPDPGHRGGQGLIGTAMMEKPASSPQPNKYSGLLAAIGLSSAPTTPKSKAQMKNLPYTTFSSRRKSETFLSTTSLHTPATTLENVSSGPYGYRKDSAGSSQEMGRKSSEYAGNTQPGRRRSLSRSVHTRQSSSVTTFAQSASVPYWEGGILHDGGDLGGTGKWVTPQRRGSVSGAVGRRKSVTADEEIPMSPVRVSTERQMESAWSGGSRSHGARRSNSLPTGTEPPVIVAGQSFGPYSTPTPDASPPRSPSNPPSRTPSKKPTRKRAPQLPSGTERSSPVSGQIPNSPAFQLPIQYLSTQDDSAYSPTSANTGSTSTHATGMLGNGVRKVSEDGHEGAVFNSFGGAKKDAIVLLMPDLPADAHRGRRR